ncbi:hypothetical protein CLOM_g3764 [Closterium sp. NIES-68]|nr:hypothetical protein CLOM_g3764 [Closterium sp. NIES-68]
MADGIGRDFGNGRSAAGTGFAGSGVAGTDVAVTGVAGTGVADAGAAAVDFGPAAASAAAFGGGMAAATAAAARVSALVGRSPASVAYGKAGPAYGRACATHGTAGEAAVTPAAAADAASLARAAAAAARAAAAEVAAGGGMRGGEKSGAGQTAAQAANRHQMVGSEKDRPKGGSARHSSGDSGSGGFGSGSSGSGRAGEERMWQKEGSLSGVAAGAAFSATCQNPSGSWTSYDIQVSASLSESKGQSSIPSPSDPSDPSCPPSPLPPSGSFLTSIEISNSPLPSLSPSISRPERPFQSPSVSALSPWGKERGDEKERSGREGGRGEGASSGMGRWNGERGFLARRVASGSSKEAENDDDEEEVGEDGFNYQDQLPDVARLIRPQAPLRLSYGVSPEALRGVKLRKVRDDEESEERWEEERRREERRKEERRKEEERKKLRSNRANGDGQVGGKQGGDRQGGDRQGGDRLTDGGSTREGVQTSLRESTASNASVFNVYSGAREGYGASKALGVDPSGSVSTARPAVESESEGESVPEK